MLEDKSLVRRRLVSFLAAFFDRGFRGGGEAITDAGVVETMFAGELGAAAVAI